MYIKNKILKTECFLIQNVDKYTVTVFICIVETLPAILYSEVLKYGWILTSERLDFAITFRQNAFSLWLNFLICIVMYSVYGNFKYVYNLIAVKFNISAVFTFTSLFFYKIHIQFANERILK